MSWHYQCVSVIERIINFAVNLCSCVMFVNNCYNSSQSKLIAILHVKFMWLSKLNIYISKLHLLHGIWLPNDWLIKLRYSSDITLRLRAVYSRVRVFNSRACYWAIDKQCLQVNQQSISSHNFSWYSVSVCDIMPSKLVPRHHKVPIH